MEHARDYGPIIFEMEYRDYYDQPVISGDNIICYPNSKTYSVQDFYNVTYSWTTSSNLQINGSSTGRTVSVSPTSSASSSEFVTVSIYIPNYDKTHVITKTVWAGPPTPDISGTISPRCGYTYTYRVDKTSKSVGQSFYWESDILDLGSPYSSSCTATPYMDGEGYISCTVTSCGVSQTGSMYVLAKLCDGYNLKIAPNPADDHVEITLTEKSPPENATSDKISIKPNDNPTFTIRVSSFTGNVVYTSQKIPQKFTIPLSNLQNGNYFIDVSDGRNNYRQQLIIKH